MIRHAGCVAAGKTVGLDQKQKRREKEAFYSLPCLSVFREVPEMSAINLLEFALLYESAT